MVVASYQALWDSFAARRRSAAIITPRSDNGPAHPLRNDPFAGYPTALLDGKASIALNPGAFEIWFKTIRHNPIVSFAPYLFLSDENTDKLLSELGECEIDTLLNHVPAESRGLAHRTVACSIN